MIREARKADQEENTVIWGLATDGVEYRFFRIGNDSTVSGRIQALEAIITESYIIYLGPHERTVYLAA